MPKVSFGERRAWNTFYTAKGQLRVVDDVGKRYWKRERGRGEMKKEWQCTGGRRGDQRKRFIYPAVYKRDTTQGLIVTEISKPVVCWVGWEVAASAV